jgi:hypothetical protein
MSALGLDVLSAATLAVTDLDGASVGPFLFSRPFVVGPLLGWIFGDPWTGALLGGTIEALTLVELPLGGRLDLSAGVAAGVAAWLACGAPQIPRELALALGLFAGFIHARLERRWRARRADRVDLIEEGLRAGRPPHLGGEIARALALQAAGTFAFVAAAVAFYRLLAPVGWAHAPEFLRVGVRTAFFAAPWIGAGAAAAVLAGRA